MLIRDFLKSTSTQLSYHGLFVLAQSLQPGELVALFRNSHLSVLYRRLPQEGAEEHAQQQSNIADLIGESNGTNAPADRGSSAAAPVPQLFTLATDSAFLLEDEVVWESLGDVDQAASEFYNGKFHKTRIEGDWVGLDARGRRRPNGIGMGAAGTDGAVMDESGRVIPPGEDADFALAAQLQEEEQRRANQGRRVSRGGQGSSAAPGLNADDDADPRRHRASNSKSGGKGGLGGLLKKSKNKRGQQSTFLDQQEVGGGSSQAQADGKDKEKCTIM